MMQQRITEKGGSLCRSSLSAVLLVALLTLAQPIKAARTRRMMNVFTISGEARVISITAPGETQRAILLDTAQGRVQLVVPKKSLFEGLQTGMSIRATGSWLGRTRTSSNGPTGQMSRSRFLVSRIQKSGGKKGPAPKVIRRDGGMGVSAAAAETSSTTFRPPLTANALIQRDLSTIFIPIAGVTTGGDACPGTSMPRVSVEQVKRTVFFEANRNGTTVGSIYGQCSHGKTVLNSANSLVAPLVKLPCSGTNYGVNWSFQTCNFDDFNGWSDAADEALAARGVVLGRYKFRVYLIPPSACGFVGLAYVGCDDTYICRAWIGADFWNSADAITHELGHNLFLGHAGAPTGNGQIDEYGDITSFMGYCCMERCPNTPQAWQMGWITVEQLDATNLKPGQTVQLQLASQAVAQQSGLRVNVGSWSVGMDSVFLGYRTAERGDRGLALISAGRVHVYTAPTTNTYDARPSLWRAGLLGGQSWAHPTVGLVVRHRGMADGQAVVSICRSGGAETTATCTAGTDNDCNGLAGAADPACGPLLAALSG